MYEKHPCANAPGLPSSVLVQKCNVKKKKSQNLLSETRRVSHGVRFADSAAVVFACLCIRQTK